MTDAMHNPWREWLHSRLRGRPTPMLVMPDALWSAASLWAGVRAWTYAFRASGLGRGDRLVCAVPEGPAFVQVLLACLWEEIAFAPVAPDDDARGAILALHARAAVAVTASGIADIVAVFVPDAASQPPLAVPRLSPAAFHDVGAAALCTSEADHSGARAWRSWSTDTVHTLLDQYDVVGSALDARVLSVHGWHDAFGIVTGILSPLRRADEIVRDASGGSDLDALARTARQYEVTHVALSPSCAAAMLEHEECRALLHRVRGGVVGGGVVGEVLGEALRHTRLRVVGA